MNDRENKRVSLYGFETIGVDRRRVEKKSIPDIKHLWQKNHEILGLCLQGFSTKDIAETLNICRTTVSNTLNSELGQKKLSEMRKERDGEFIDVSKKIAELSEKALEMYEQIFDSTTISHNLKKSTADTVLMDLGGHRAPTKIDSRHITTTATLEEIEEFKRLGHIAAKEAGYLIEIKEETEDEPEKITE